MAKWLLIAIMVWIAIPNANGQSNSNLVKKKIAVGRLFATDSFDSRIIVPGTFFAVGVDTSCYSLNPITATIQWLKEVKYDSIDITYRVFDFGVNTVYYTYRIDSIADRYYAEKTKVVSEEKMLFQRKSGLKYSGSFGRTLQMGNATSATLNSVFNMQIEGMLADSIEVMGAITDNTLSIQPDGTTQQLNDFDQIWLKFKKKDWILNLGDIDIRRKPNYFMQYFKRQQGIVFETKNSVGKNATMQSFASGAIAKGKFQRNIIQGVEGNQGPYRLQGPNDELYFAILAGSEKVFIDGILLQRGENLDYTIDYNMAELVFTSNKLITKDSRIQIEFEYADRNYLNALIYTDQVFTIGNKFNAGFAYYQLGDAKSSPIQQELSNEQVGFLQSNSSNNFYFPSERLVPNESNRILYQKFDTIVDGNPYSYFAHSNATTDSLYTVAFTKVGVGNGDYILDLNANNGNVFVWQPPQNGMKQGEYDPFIKISPPKKQTLLAGKLAWMPNQHLTFTSEIGRSTFSQNTFAKENRNNVGIGLRNEATYSSKLNWVGTKLHLNAFSFFEKETLEFKPIERLRDVEFLRDWGLPFQTVQSAENLKGAGVRLTDSVATSFEITTTQYIRGDSYSGWKTTMNFQFKKSGYMLDFGMHYTPFASSNFRGLLFFPALHVSKKLSKKRESNIGIRWTKEHNEIIHLFTDTLMHTAFKFFTKQVYFNRQMQNKSSFQIDWFRRDNAFPDKYGFLPLDFSNQWNLNWKWYRFTHHSIILNAGYRSLQIKTKGLTHQNEDKTLLARIEYSGKLLKGMIITKLLFETGSAQEQRRNYLYVEVPAGRGEYAWIDYNSDGKQQLNEFEPAIFADQQRYIKIYTPTNDYVKANYNQLNYHFSFNPPSEWSKKKDSWKYVIGRVQAQSNWQVGGHASSNQNLMQMPWLYSIQDTGLIRFSSNLIHTISYNRQSSKWGIDFQQFNNLQKGLLLYGFEVNKMKRQQIKLRINSGRKWLLTNTIKWGNQQLITPSEKFSNRNYMVQSLQFAPEISFIQPPTFKVQIGMFMDLNTGISQEKAQSSKHIGAKAELRLNIVSKGNLIAKFQYGNINFSGTQNSTVSYIMLQGLAPGKNLVWNINFTRRLFGNMELNFQYDGRKPGINPIVHLGTASVRAVF